MSLERLALRIFLLFEENISAFAGTQSNQKVSPAQF